jgi:hypothetical protein
MVADRGGIAMGSPTELIARAVALHQTTPEILAASAQVGRRLLGVDSTFAAIADTVGNCCKPPSAPPTRD